MKDKNLAKEELDEKAKNLSEKEKELVERATDCILSFLKEKNIDYSSFEDELKNTITKNIDASLMVSKLFIAFM